jgi:APA family basic amino acid/polyamine antiporter
VVITIAIGRVAGPLWVVAGFAVYYIYRRYRRLPVLQSLPRDWSRMQIEVYEESGETGLADEYRDALRRAERKQKGPRPPGAAPPPQP